MKMYVATSNCLKCIASQCLSPPCLLFFSRNCDGRRTRVSIKQRKLGLKSVASLQDKIKINVTQSIDICIHRFICLLNLDVLFYGVSRSENCLIINCLCNKVPLL